MRNGVIGLAMIPDAPWIRDAEQNGMPSPESVYCPECGEECETIYVDSGGIAIGCDKCLRAKDAGEWQEEQREKEREWYEEHFSFTD